MFAIDAAAVPTGFSTDEFVLLPLTTDHTELDYEAVMASRDQLRVWEQDTWPADDFTVDSNRDDLQRHQDLHVEGLAFTYTVMDPAETECLGCVYLFPPEAKFLARSAVTSLEGDRWEETDAAVYHWVRSSLVGTGFDERFFDALVTWMAEAWPIDQNVFVTNERLTDQLALHAASGLTRRFLIEEPDKPGRYVAFG